MLRPEAKKFNYSHDFQFACKKRGARMERRSRKSHPNTGERANYDLRKRYGSYSAADRIAT
jgi:hypothetical protein